MSNYDNKNSGALFLNTKKTNDNQPDRTGSLNVEGVDYWVSGWLKKSKDGNPFLSLAVKLKEQKNSSPQTPPKEDFADDIPF